MILIFLLLGMLMDWVDIVLLVLPVFLPIILKLPVAELGLSGAPVGPFIGIRLLVLAALLLFPQITMVFAPRIWS